MIPIRPTDVMRNGFTRHAVGSGFLRDVFRPETAAYFVGKLPKSQAAKNRCQFGADTGSMVLGSSHLVPCKNEGWFDPAKAPWAGGLGFTEPVPDRTVSGNEGMFVGQWGAR